MKPLAIDLPHNQSTLIDDADLPTITGRHWYVTGNGYVGAMWHEGGRRGMLLLHRLLTGAPTGSHVDHINGDKLDNRRSNLRITTPSLNGVNRKRLNRNNTSGLRGVSWLPRKERWLAQITVNSRHIFLGHYSSPEEALERRRAAEIELWGEQCPVP